MGMWQGSLEVFCGAVLNKKSSLPTKREREREREGPRERSLDLRGPTPRPPRFSITAFNTLRHGNVHTSDHTASTSSFISCVCWCHLLQRCTCLPPHPLSISFLSSSFWRPPALVPLLAGFRHGRDRHRCEFFLADLSATSLSLTLLLWQPYFFLFFWGEGGSRPLLRRGNGTTKGGGK